MMKNVSARNVLLAICIAGLITLASSIIWNSTGRSFFVALLFNDAQEFAETGSITSSFMPIGYSSFVGACMGISGEGGVPACQSVIYIGVLLAAFWFLKPREGGYSIFRALGVLAIALHPVLILNIWRIHDGNTTALLLLALAAASIAFIRYKDMRRVMLLGAISGLLFAVRPNTISLIPITLLLLLATEGAGTAIKRLGKVVLFSIIAASFVMGINIAVKQTPFFFARHGMYNLFAGTNEYAEEYLLSKYTGEASLEEALWARGHRETTFEEKLAFPSEKYKEFALEYAVNHPFQYIKLAGIKLITFFRPGYHVPEGFSWMSIEGVKRIAKIVLALPFFIWAFVVWKRRESFFEKENILILLLAIFYIAPFLLANADPRMRFPLDILLIADSFRRAT